MSFPLIHTLLLNKWDRCKVFRSKVSEMKCMFINRFVITVCKAMMSKLTCFYGYYRQLLVYTYIFPVPDVFYDKLIKLCAYKVI